jgi:pimeloyl-ACP methyl ester carboxylesterase
MAAFLLVHGACHGAWCWRDMLPLLNANGHTASAIDLPAHGADTTAIGDCTLDAYVEKVLDAIAEPVILVGHSLAGMTISQAAENAPDKIARLVYLCAWLPRDGKSARDMSNTAPRQLLREALKWPEDRKSTYFDPAMVEAKFYHDCPPGTLAYAQCNLCAEPTLPSATPVSLTTRFQSVPRNYIRCADDQAIPPEFQATMALDCPPQNVFEMACAHSPFFAQPDILAEILFKIAKA